MNRRELVQRMGMFGVMGTLPFSLSGESLQKPEAGADAQLSKASPLKPPAQGSIPVAFVISKGAVVIDFSGPGRSSRMYTFPGVRRALFGFTR